MFAEKIGVFVSKITAMHSSQFSFFIHLPLSRSFQLWTVAVEICNYNILLHNTVHIFPVNTKALQGMTWKFLCWLIAFWCLVYLHDLEYTKMRMTVVKLTGLLIVWLMTEGSITRSQCWYHCVKSSTTAESLSFSRNG